MSRVKNPEEKKRLSLAEDHRTFPWKGNKSFRSAWTLKKAKANRRLRRAATVALASGDGDVSTAVTAKPKRTLYKHGVHSLAETISIKKRKRSERFRRRKT